MDFSFLVPLVVIVVVMARVSKEFSKVSRNRPSGGNPGGGMPGSGGGEGARSIADFLEDLKRQAQAAQMERAENGEELQTRLREKVREAARLRRDAAGYAPPPPIEPRSSASLVASALPPILQTVAAAPPPPSVARGAPAKVAAAERKSGLAHPVFGGDPAGAEGLARRAVLLREILGPPVGLRGSDSGCVGM